MFGSRPQRALPTETNVESGTSPSKSGTSVNLSKSGDLGQREVEGHFEEVGPEPGRVQPWRACFLLLWGLGFGVWGYIYIYIHIDRCIYMYIHICIYIHTHISIWDAGTFRGGSARAPPCPALASMSLPVSGWSSRRFRGFHDVPRRVSKIGDHNCETELNVGSQMWFQMDISRRLGQSPAVSSPGEHVSSCFRGGDLVTRRGRDENPLSSEYGTYETVKALADSGLGVQVNGGLARARPCPALASMSLPVWVCMFSISEQMRSVSEAGS